MMLSQGTLVVEIPEGLQVECHGVNGLHRRPGALEIPVGGMLAGATRTIALFVSRSDSDSAETDKLPAVLKMQWKASLYTKIRSHLIFRTNLSYKSSQSTSRWWNKPQRPGPTR